MEEQLVFFPCGDANLAGILTIAAEPNGRTILIPWGAGQFPSSGKNRVRTRLARTFAEHGFNAFRFDYRGVGESQGDYQKPDMAEPNTADIVAACAWLTSRGLPRIVVVAHCYGGWSSLMAAPMIPGIEGMAIVNAPVWRDHKEVRGSKQRWAKRLMGVRLSKLRSPSHRAAYRNFLIARASSFLGLGSKAKGSSTVGSASRSGRFSRAVRYLLDKRIPVLLLYGDDDFRADFESELDGGLRALVETAGPPTRVVALPERFAGASIRAQDLLLDNLVPWLHELPNSSS